MTAQLYLEEILNESLFFYKKMEEHRKEFPEFFENFSKDSALNLPEDKLESLFKTSQLINDNQVQFDKVASFVYFCSKLKIELDLSKISEINGLNKFVINFKPFETDNVKGNNDELEIKNKKENDSKFKSFKDNFLNILNINI